MANRPGVEKIIGHGLFSAGDTQPDIAKVQEELSEYPGNVWTHIVSLRREDAARLGYDSVEAWKGLLTRNAMQIAAAMQIKPENFRWYAAFHDESYHPHVHMIAWSIDPKEAYLTTKGIQKIKAKLAQDIFKNDLLEIYTAQTKTRDELRQESREKLQTALTQIEQGSFFDPILEELLARLSHKLKQTKGKKVYGYLPKDIKKLVDTVVDRLALDPRIAALYDVWYERRFEVLQTYTDTLPEKLPLSQNKDFRPIRNAVVEIADAMDMDYSKEMALETEQDGDSPAISEGAHPTRSLADSTLALLQQTARIIENKLDNDPKISRTADRKLLSKIADKKLAQGLKLE